MNSKNYDEIQKKVPELVKMKRKYLEEKREKEYYKGKVSIHEREIEQRDNYIKELEEAINEQIYLTKHTIESIESLIPANIKVKAINETKKAKSHLKIIK